MSKVLKKGFYWALDYIYVTRSQLRSFFSQSSSNIYRRKNAVPVLLIPGVYENWHFMQPIAQVLYTRGYDVHVIDGLGYNRGTIEEMAALVIRYIEKKQLRNSLIVAHSKGGLIGKYVLSRTDPQLIPLGMVALNTPFSGSIYAYALPIKSLRIFSPHSAILTSLSKNVAINAQIISIFGIFDPHIPKGSYLEGSINIQLNTYGHFRIMADQQVHIEILKGLETLIHQPRR